MVIIAIVDIRKIIMDELVRRQWSQGELCRQTGLLPHRVAEYLSGGRDIYVGTLQRIMEALDLEIRLAGGQRISKGASAMFVVFEDLADATETKVHKDSCSYYFNRKPNAPTTRWHGPYETYEAAAAAARSIAQRKSYGVKLRPRCCWKD